MPSVRKIFDKQLTGFFRCAIYVPKNAANIKLQAVAFGGAGGIGDGIAGGGGGGAGAYYDGPIDVIPNSIIIIDSINEGGIPIMTINWTAFSSNENQFANRNRQMLLPSGVPGDNGVGGVAGVGGQSGCGCIGGTASNNPRPECYVDFDGLAHSTGGWCGTDASVPAVSFANFAVEKGGTRLAYAKHPGPRHLTGFNQGGYGGVSYFGCGGSPNNFDAGFGGGGSGTIFPSSPRRGGDAFVKLIWDWAI